MAPPDSSPTPDDLASAADALRDELADSGAALSIPEIVARRQALDSATVSLFMDTLAEIHALPVHPC